MFIYKISNDTYHDKVLKPSVVTIRRLPNDKEAIHNNIRILIVYRTETRIFVTSLKWSSSPARVLTRCWIIGHTCLELVYVKKLFTDERKLKWSPSYDKWINQMFWWSWTYIHTESDWIPLFDFCIRNWYSNLIHQ